MWVLLVFLLLGDGTADILAAQMPDKAMCESVRDNIRGSLRRKEIEAWKDVRAEVKCVFTSFGIQNF